jgi:hypothetical protein
MVCFSDSLVWESCQRSAIQQAKKHLHDSFTNIKINVRVRYNAYFGGGDERHGLTRP